MRVFAPERVLTYRFSSGRLSCLPLAGEWVDIPDYFRQVTRNNRINDVVHAKLVDSASVPYTYWDHTVRLQSGAAETWTEVADDEFDDLSYSYAPYQTIQRFVELAPSPNYKGKSKKKRFAERYVREKYPLCGAIRTIGYAPNNKAWYYNASIEIVVPNPEVSQVKDFGTVQCPYLSFTTKGTVDYQAKVVNFSVNCPIGDPADWDWLVDILRSYSGVGYPKWCDSHECRNRIYAGLVNMWRSKGEEYSELIYQRTVKAKWHVFYKRNMTACPCTSLPYPDIDFRSAFLFSEPELIGERLDPLLAGTKGGISNHWIQVATQHALLEACDSLPRLSDNSISNLIEIVGFIKALVVDHKIEIPKSLADAWLSYRYQYSTTKMDVQDAIKFVRRHTDLGTLDRMIVGRGTHVFDYMGSNVVCRCGIEVTPKETSYLKKIWRALDQYGLTPDFYVIWDSIPYSFMVDWFLPVSDIVSVWDANAMYFSGEYYTFDGCCYSLKYTRELDGYTIQCYTRWLGSVPSSLNSFYWLEAPSAGCKTVGYRILDAASIFIGR